MRWALSAGTVIVGLVVLIVIVGYILPRDHVAAMSARINAAPDAVWTALTTSSDFPGWRPNVTRVEALPDGAHGPAWREFSKNSAVTMETQAFEPPRRLVVRIANADLPYGGSWEYAIAPDGAAASVVSITERGSVYNPVFRFVSRFVMGHTATIDTYLRQLGTRFGGRVEPAVITVR